MSEDSFSNVREDQVLRLNEQAETYATATMKPGAVILPIDSEGLERSPFQLRDGTHLKQRRSHSQY